jgi:hypothetical protein
MTRHTKHTDDFDTHQVLPSRDTAWNGIRHLSLVSDEPVDTPSLAGGGQSILVDFEPFETSDAALKSIVYFCAKTRCWLEVCGVFQAIVLQVNDERSLV